MTKTGMEPTRRWRHIDGCARPSAVFLLWILSALSAALGQTRVAIENVTLIDGTDHTPRSHVTVVIEGERILAIVAKNARQPKRTRIIDGTGKFLIPGLWNNDLHA